MFAFSKISYKDMQIDHKVEDQSPIKIHFIYLAFVLQPLKNEFITPTIHVCLFGVNHTRTNVETIPGPFYVVNCH